MMSRSQAQAAPPALPLAHRALQAQVALQAAPALMVAARDLGSLAEAKEAPGEQKVAEEEKAPGDQEANHAAAMPRSATKSLPKSMPKLLQKSETTRTMTTRFSPRLMPT